MPQSDIVRIHTSSGTTGRPTVVGYTAADIDGWANPVARCLRAAAVRSTDKVHIACGYGLFPGGLGAHYGAERLGCTVIPISGGMTERQLQLITDFRPHAIVAALPTCSPWPTPWNAPASTHAKPPYAQEFSVAEPWINQMRREVEDKLDFNAVDIYGLSEVIGPGVAQECAETKVGPRVWEDHFYPRSSIHSAEKSCPMAKMASWSSPR